MRTDFAELERFVYLKHTLALILIFIGGKIIHAEFGGHISPTASPTKLALLGGRHPPLVVEGSPSAGGQRQTT